MNAYRVKAHGLHSELDATLDRLSKSRASHKKIIAERDQTIAGLQVAINEMHIRAVDAEAGFPCVNERDTTITSLRDSLVAANAHAAKLEREAHKDRASIVAFLAAEAKRRDKQAAPEPLPQSPEADIITGPGIRLATRSTIRRDVRAYLLERNWAPEALDAIGL
jgi:hypothetical protein